MSVRRLSLDQPASFAFSPETLKAVQGWMGNFPPGKQQSAVIATLWLVQKQEGWVSEPAIRAVGELLGMPFIRVLEVATFYTMFMLEPVGKTALIQVCGTTPCMLRGAGELMAVCKDKIGPKDHLSADGAFTWQDYSAREDADAELTAALNKLDEAAREVAAIISVIVQQRIDTRRA